MCEVMWHRCGSIHVTSTLQWHTGLLHGVLAYYGIHRWWRTIAAAAGELLYMWCIILHTTLEARGKMGVWVLTTKSCHNKGLTMSANTLPLECGAGIFGYTLYAGYSRQHLSVSIVIQFNGLLCHIVDWVLTLFNNRLPNHERIFHSLPHCVVSWPPLPYIHFIDFNHYHYRKCI